MMKKLTKIHLKSEFRLGPPGPSGHRETESDRFVKKDAEAGLQLPAALHTVLRNIPLVTVPNLAHRWLTFRSSWTPF